MKRIAESDRIALGPDVSQRVLPSYEKAVADQLTEQKGKVIDRFFTNQDSDIVAFRDAMPSIVAGALVARTSRAQDDDIREVFWNEFYSRPEFGLEEMNGRALGVAEKKAGAIIGRILADYGDDSVREQASGYVAVRNHSILSSLNVFRAKLIKAIEASTRYIDWSEKVDGVYRYVRDQKLVDSEFAPVFLGAADGLFVAYGKILPVLWRYVEEKNPRGEIGQWPYAQAVKGRVFDNLRKLIPLAAKTNYVLHGDYRTLSELVMDLGASLYDEDRLVASGMAKELLAVNPKFMEVVESRHAGAWTRHRQKTSEIVGSAVKIWRMDNLLQKESVGVDVRVVNQDWLSDLALGFVDLACKIPEGTRKQIAQAMIRSGQIKFVLRQLGDARGNRRHKVLEAFQRVVVEANFRGLSLSVIKDFNRQRNILDKSAIDWSADSGVFVPEDIQGLGGEALDEYRRATDRAIEAYHFVKKVFPEEAKLILPQGTRSRFTIQMGLGEALWISELRTLPSGDPEYRPFGRMLWEKIVNAMPELEQVRNFVDKNDYPLNRIKEAVRADLDRGANED